jgi:hypothetical protein
MNPNNKEPNNTDGINPTFVNLNTCPKRKLRKNNSSKKAAATTFIKTSSSVIYELNLNSIAKPINIGNVNSNGTKIPFKIEPENPRLFSNLLFL